ncbi:hypothetical protein CHUAL_012807 [Chamberlinius hualienensis]
MEKDNVIRNNGGGDVELSVLKSNENSEININDKLPETVNPVTITTNGQLEPTCNSIEDETTGTETTNNIGKKQKYGFWDGVCVFISLCTYIFDQVTDVMVAVYFFNKAMYWYFGLTLAFVIVPSITMTVFSLTWYIQDYKEGVRPPGSRLQWTLRAIGLFLNCGPILRYFESFCYGCQLNKSNHKADLKETYFYIMIYEDTDASLLRLFECFMESAPQLVLQIYILVLGEIPETLQDPLKISLQGLSIMSSLISLSWAIASYNRSLRMSLDKKMKLNWAATIFQFMWRFCSISSRVLSLALFASYFKVYVFVVCGIHWGVMTFWIIWQKTEFCKRRWEEFFFDMVMGIVYIFAFINVKEEPTRYKTAFYHLFILVEGSVIMILWYVFSNQNVWYHLPALLGFYALFFLGILLMIAYYLYFHPKVSFRQQVSVNGDMPDGIMPSNFKKKYHCGDARKLSRRPRTEPSTVDENAKL